MLPILEKTNIWEKLRMLSMFILGPSWKNVAIVEDFFYLFKTIKVLNLNFAYINKNKNISLET